MHLRFDKPIKYTFQLIIKIIVFFIDCHFVIKLNEKRNIVDEFVYKWMMFNINIMKGIK